MSAIQLLEYQIAPGVKAFSTSRKGGVSAGAYAEMNITHYCGDDPENVAKNRALLCAELGIADEVLFLPHQVHGTEVMALDADFLQLTPEARQEAMEGVDAVVTDQRGICIGVSTADCLPILLYDAEHHVTAAIHAGWRGTVAKIVERTVHFMEERFGCSPDMMKAVMGPCISLNAFEVGDEVYAAFAEAGFPMEGISQRMRNAETGEEKWHIDLLAANYELLEACGLQLENVQVAGICTYALSDSFFSARKMGIQSGRIFTGILMNS